MWILLHKHAEAGLKLNICIWIVLNIQIQTVEKWKTFTVNYYFFPLVVKVAAKLQGAPEQTWKSDFLRAYCESEMARRGKKLSCYLSCLL